MKLSAYALLLCACFAAPLSAHAQVAPAATGRQLRLNAGAEFSNYQPDFTGAAAVAQSSPQRLDGIGVYIDADFTRWVQIEAEGRWLHWNPYTQFGAITQNTYMIGPRVPIVEDLKGFTPYGKILIGWGSGPFLTGRTTAWAYGGGTDFQLSRKISLRCIDFEYQDWVVQPTLHPWGLSAGLSYRIF